MTVRTHIAAVDLRWSIRKRLTQGFGALARTTPPPPDSPALAALPASQLHEFRRLNAFDQTHLVRVWQWLVDLAVEDQDLLTAGLLHDVGKVDGNARVRLVDRGLKVVLRAAWPGLLDRLSRPGGPRWAAGLYLAVHHPELGAQRARALGCSERVCWLIEHHETQPDFGDPGLRLLRQADRAS